MTQDQLEDAREIQVTEHVVAYVSDAGYLVIRQEHGDVEHIALEPDEIGALQQALTKLRPIAAAKHAAVWVCQEAELRAWQAGSGSGDGT